MSPRRAFLVCVLGMAFSIACAAASAQSSVRDSGEDADTDPGQRIGLAELPAYRVALSGKPTADDAKASDPTRPASFRDLWDHADAWRGRRVRVEGRVARVFRQGAIGSLPALAEVWLATAGGDLFCVHCPDPGPGPSAIEPGTPVAFSGTFLKTIRYPAGDQPRLAPLIVGEQPPTPSRDRAATADPGAAFRAIGGVASNEGNDAESWSTVSWIIGLVLLGGAGAAVVARQHLRSPSGRRTPGVRSDGVDPPLEFVER